MGDVFRSNCTPAEMLLLEQLAREHPRRILLKRSKNELGEDKLEIDIKDEKLKDFVVFMLTSLRDRAHQLELLYKQPDWVFED